MSREIKSQDGNIEISEAVLISFVEKTVAEFRGISLSKKKRAVKISHSEYGNTIDLGLDVDYGTEIPDLAKELQRAVKECLTTLAGIEVKEINVIIEGLNIDGLVKK